MKQYRWLQTGTMIVGERYDPVVEQRADITIGQWRVSIEELWNYVHVQLLHEGRMLADSRDNTPLYGLVKMPKIQHRLLKVLDLLFELEKYGRRMWGTLLWDKLPMNVNRALCMLRGHWWHYEDMGGLESGPGPIESHCLRCDAVEDPNSGGVVYYDNNDAENYEQASEQIWEQAREWGADSE